MITGLHPMPIATALRSHPTSYFEGFPATAQPIESTEAQGHEGVGGGLGDHTDGVECGPLAPPCLLSHHSGLPKPWLSS